MGENTFSNCLIISWIACFFLGLGLCFTNLEKYENIQEPMVKETITDELIIEEYKSPYYVAMDMYRNFKNFVKFTPVIIETVPQNLEEFNCVMYATEPIGRYYITAYNDEETHCKITASGVKCHEGTITTCAADPRYHRFGEYLEIGGKLYKVEDTGSAVKKRHIDIFFDDYKTMARYGSHYENIYRVSFPFGKPKEK